ncbi:MAG: secretin N-terminal domain-containing protein, partial [Armatimonadota bacterium]
MGKRYSSRLLLFWSLFVMVVFVLTLALPLGNAQERSSSASASRSSRSDEADRDEEEEEEETKGTEDGPPVFVVVPEQRDGEELISFSFDQADIDDVLKFLADASGKVMYKDPEVETQVTIVSMAKVTVPDAFKVLSGLLSVKGYTMFERDGEVVITTKEKGKVAGGKTAPQVGRDPEQIRATEEIITQIVQIEFVDASALANDLKPLFPDKGDTGLLLSNADTNTIVIIDTGERVKRIVKLINELDKDTTEVMEVDVIQLEFAEATEIASLIEDMFEQRSPFRGLSSDAMRRLTEAMRSRSGSGGGGGPGVSVPTGLTALRGEVRIEADERTNSVVVSASKANLDNIRTVIEKLDIDILPNVIHKSFTLEYADATTVSEQLGQLFDDQTGGGGGSRGFYGSYYRSSYYGRSRQPEASGLQPNRVVPDTRTNSIIVTAEEEDMAAFEALINDLDRESPLEEVVRVFELEHANAAEVAEALYDVFQGAGGRQQGFFFALFGRGRGGSDVGGGPLEMLQEVQVVADEASNKLIVSGPAQSFDLVQQLINDLDKPLPQVFIEVVIADVTLDQSHQFGFQWQAITTSGSTTSDIGTDLGVATTDPTTAAGFQYSILSRNFQSLLRALETQRDVEVI